MIPVFSPIAISVALANSAPRLASSTVANASFNTLLTRGSEWRPRLEAPIPLDLSCVANNDFNGEEGSPVPEPHPTRTKLNSGNPPLAPFEARLKKTFLGIVTTFVGIPWADSI